MKRRFEFEEGKSKKFWQVEVSGATLTVCFGRLETAGTTKAKSFPSNAGAEREATKLISEKTRKGYVEVGAGSSKAPAKAAAPTTKPSAKAAPKPAAPGPKTSGLPRPIAALLEAIALKAKWLLPHLAPGASPEALRKLEALDAPPLMLALYGAHDGTDAGTWRNYPLYSIERLLKERDQMNKILATRPDWRHDRIWDSSWIPFMGEDGQFICVDPKGACEGSAVQGQLLFYDHETGASREFASFEVFVDLLTRLAKAELLDPEVQEENEKYEKLCAEAKRVGVQMMPAKELKALEKKLDGENPPTAEQTVELVLPLARKFSADRGLWTRVATAASMLEDWKLLVEASTNAMQLASRDKKNDSVSDLVVGLHRMGADDRALGVLREAATRQQNHLTSLVNAPQLSTEFTVRAYQAILEKQPSATPVWLALAKVATGDVRRNAAEQAIALEFSPKAFSPSAQRAIEAHQILSEGLSPAEKAEAFAAFVPARDSKLPIKEERWRFCEPLATVAIEAGDWKRVLEASDVARYDKKTVLDDPTQVRLSVRARFELGDEADALAELQRSAKKIAKEGDLDVAKGLAMLPWNVFPTLPIAPGVLLGTPVLTGSLDPATAKANQTRFQRQCFEVLAKLQPNEACWRYGLAHYAPEGARAAELRALLELTAAKSPSDGKPSAWQEEAKAIFQLRLRVLLELGQTDAALAMVKHVAENEESSFESGQVLPFRPSEVAQLAEPVRVWVAEAYWELGQAEDPTFDVLVAAALYTTDAARRSAALDRLVQTQPPPKAGLKEPDVLSFRANIEALFESGRDDDALEVLATSLKRAPREGESRLPLAVPFQKDYLSRQVYGDDAISTRTKDEQEAFLERWYETVAAKRPNDAAVWATRAALSSDPKRKRVYLEEATKRVHLEAPNLRNDLRRKIFELRIGL